MGLLGVITFRRTRLEESVTCFDFSTKKEEKAKVRQTKMSYPYI
jgi:hypothetical protein